MKKFVLDEAGNFSELRQISAEYIDFMHHPQNPADLTFARKDRLKSLSRSPRVLEVRLTSLVRRPISCSSSGLSSSSRCCACKNTLNNLNGSSLKRSRCS